MTRQIELNDRALLYKAAWLIEKMKRALDYYKERESEVVSVLTQIETQANAKGFAQQILQGTPSVCIDPGSGVIFYLADEPDKEEENAKTNN